MAGQRLEGIRVAVLATNGFEQAELEKPVEALKAAGAEVEVISPTLGQIQGMEHDEKGRKVDVDRALADADAADYHALVLPGGVGNPDKLRVEPSPWILSGPFQRPTSPLPPSVMALGRSSTPAPSVAGK